jgi:hypothetical protein
MSEPAQYKRLYSSDGDIITPEGEREWHEYPGNRRNECLPQSSSPPRGSLLVKTGGNALQAIDMDALDKAPFISVVVPEGKAAGDTIHVNCPYWKGRLIKTTIPTLARPGDSFLVQTPPMVPHVVTGVPVDPDDEETRISVGRDNIAAAAEHELSLREESKRSEEGTGMHDGVEMTSTNQKDAKGPDGKGWVAAMFMGKMLLG